MVNIVIAGATSQLANEVIEKLAASDKHRIIGLVRKDPKSLPIIPSVEWVQTTYAKEELVDIFKGVHTVLSFVAVHLDQDNKTQKSLINASVEAGVKRFAPSEWATGVGLENHLDCMPWYAGKVEIANYLKDVNKDVKVLEYCRFQPGAWLDYVSHPHALSKHVVPTSFLFNYVAGTAIAVEGHLDEEVTYTSTPDIARVVARAVEYQGEWPTVGGISGDRATTRKFLELGEKITGKPLKVEYLKLEDLEKGELKTDNFPRLELPSIPKDQIEEFSKMGMIGILRAQHEGLWTVTDEWNKLLPDLVFDKLGDTLLRVWGKK